MKELMFNFPLYVITHPFKGFDEMKSHRGSIYYGIIILALSGIVAALQQVYTGFAVTGIWTETPFVDIPTTLLFTYSPIILFCIANYSVTTITDGKGNMKEIFLTYTYAMYPMIFCTALGIILSNVLTANEAGFAIFLFAFGRFLLFFYLFIGLIVIHEYTFFKSLLMVALTILAILIISFVLALMFSLLGNVIGIITTIIWEINIHHM